MSKVIDAMRARELVARAIEEGTLPLELPADARDIAVGEPALVHTVRGDPSYWIVPILVARRVAGFARVISDGRISSVGTRPAAVAADQPVTGLHAADAMRRAGDRVDPALGETAREPIFVHDGPPGAREAWLIAVARGGVPARWLFITPGFVYERPAGSLRDPWIE